MSLSETQKSKIKHILYDQISRYGKDKILEEMFSKKPSLGSRISIRRIQDACWNEIKKSFIKIGNTEDTQKEKLAALVLGESMLHYFLTNAVVPSHRKVVMNEIKIDLVVPDTRTLKSDPTGAVVIVFGKQSDDFKEKISEIQPNIDNIWSIDWDSNKEEIYVYHGKKKTNDSCAEDQHGFSYFKFEEIVKRLELFLSKNKKSSSTKLRLKPANNIQQEQ